MCHKMAGKPKHYTFVWTLDTGLEVFFSPGAKIIFRTASLTKHVVWVGNLLLKTCAKELELSLEGAGPTAVLFTGLILPVANMHI